MTLLASIPEETFVKTKPLINGDKHLSLFELDHVEHLPEMGLYGVSPAEVFEDGSIFENKTLIRKSLRDPDNMEGAYTSWRVFKRRLSYKKINLNSSTQYFSMLDHWGHEYYHWAVEALPRLELALRHLKNVTVIISERYSKMAFVRESLACFPVQVEILPMKSYARLDRLYFSDFPGPSDYHRGELLCALRDRLAPSRGPANRRLFLSRDKARFRTLTNEPEVERFLKTLGFETVYAEDLLWPEQMALFSQASHLVTIHGAGLSNTLFMPKGSHVLEIRKDSFGKNKDGRAATSTLCNTYFHMCVPLGLHYSALLSPSPTPEGNYGYSDLTVDISELEELLRPTLK